MYNEGATPLQGICTAIWKENRRAVSGLVSRRRLGAGLAAAAATTSARRIIAPLTAMGVPRRKLALSLRVVTLFMSMATAAASLVTG